jgi:uncharacterized membrane protein (UPF0127 family)
MRFSFLLILILTLIGSAIATRAFLNNKDEVIKELKINDTVLQVSIANTDTERIRGLSGKTGLAEKEGLLFVFETEGYHGIWMKEMNFPIDIAWLDKDKKIIHIEKDVSPDTYPKVFMPPKPDLFVLETRAGLFQKFDIKVGDIAQLPK